MYLMLRTTDQRGRNAIIHATVPKDGEMLRKSE